MRGVSIIAAAMLVVSSAANVEAGLGSLLGKAFKTASAKVQKVMGKGAGKTGSQVAAKTGTRVAGKVGRTSARTAGAGAVASASNSVISNLGTEGAMIASQLRPESTVRLGEMAASIAKSPHRTQWLATLGEHGGKCVDWLWNHKQHSGGKSPLSFNCLKRHKVSGEDSNCLPHEASLLRTWGFFRATSWSPPAWRYRGTSFVDAPMRTTSGDES